MVWINAEIACPTKDGKIGINMQSGKNLEAVVGHEITHVLEGTEFYNEMQKILYDYADAKGELQTRRKAIEDLYEGVTQDIDSELTAELVGDYLFADQDFINRLASDNRNVFQKMFDEIKYMWKQAHPSSPEAAKLEKLKRAFEKAYNAINENTITEDGVQYALADTKNITPSAEQVNSNIQEVARMDSVYTVEESKLVPIGKSLMDTYDEYFSKWGGNIHSDLFGDVAVKKSSIRSEIRHGSTAEKIASIEAIPSVMQNGKIVNWIEKDKGVYRIIVAAPISIGDAPCLMGVMLQRDSQNQRLYLHDVVIEKEATNSMQDDLITTGSHKENGSLYTTMILQKIIDVKRNSINSKNIFEEARLSLSADGDIGPVRDDVKQRKEERINKAYTRIDNKLQQDKIALEEDLATTRADLEQQLADKSAYISNRASELYNELSNLKKGVRASKALGYLLDHGYDWNTLKSTLLKVKRWASETVNPNSVGNHRCHGFL